MRPRVSLADVVDGTDLMQKLAPRQGTSSINPHPHPHPGSLQLKACHSPRDIFIPICSPKRLPKRQPKLQLVTKLFSEQSHGLRLPSGTLSSWPGGNLVADENKSPLLTRLELHLQKELKIARTDDAKLRVHQELFGLFIEGFPAYGALLSKVKREYDGYVSLVAELKGEILRLKDELATSRAEAESSVEDGFYETNRLIQKTNDHIRTIRREMEDSMIEQRSLESLKNTLEEKVGDLGKQADRDKAELFRLRTALSYMSDVCEDLKSKHRTTVEFYENQSEIYRVEKASMQYKIEQLETVEGSS